MTKKKPRDKTKKKKATKEEDSHSEEDLPAHPKKKKKKEEDCEDEFPETNLEIVHTHCFLFSNWVTGAHPQLAHAILFQIKLNPLPE